MRLTLATCLILLVASLGSSHAAGLRIYVFDGDGGHAPNGGISISIDGQVVGQTNLDGRLSRQQSPGQIDLFVGTPERGVRLNALPVIPGEVTEVLVTLYRNQQAKTLIEHRPLDSTVDTETKGPKDEGPPGTVSGRCVTDGGRPLSGVQVFVRGRSETVSTGRDGLFTLSLPAGNHGLSFIRSGHRNARLDSIEVVADGELKLEDVLLPVANPELEELVVTVPYIEGGVAALVSERRETSNVVDVIGSEQMAKTGDGSASGALKRVTGLTVVGGKYIYVRGMGERYSSTTLNGMFVPSPEPERRVVPLDMFPTGILSSVLVQKTYSSDQPGEFGGGVVQLRTRSIPENDFLEVSLSTGYRSTTSFKEGLSYRGGDYDWLGIDSGAREFPANVARSTEDTALRTCSIALRENCLQPEDLAELGRSFPDEYDTVQRTAPMNMGISTSGGFVRSFSGHKLGGVASLQYDQDWVNEKRMRDSFRINGGEVEKSDGGTVDSLTRTIQLSGIFELGFEFGKAHRFATTTLLLRNTDDETSQFVGTNADERSDVRVTRLRWVERELFTQQVRGEHDLSTLDVNWHYGFSLADRIEPNRRISQYDRGIGTEEAFGLSSKPEGNRRFYSDLDDVSHEVAVSLRYDFDQVDEEAPATYVHVGGGIITREREVETRRFKFQGPSGQPDPLNVLFADENIGPDMGQYRLQNTTQATDDYSAEQEVMSAFVQSQWVAMKGLRFAGGLRVEDAVQEVQTFSPFTGDEPVGGRLANVDYLPSVSSTFSLTNDMQLRAGYGRTISRPEFRELSPARFDDVTNRQSVVGNPDLDRGLLDHYDLRWEWYFSGQDSLSIAGFYKSFTDPIEVKISCGADKTLTFRNSPEAKNLGAEVTVRKDFGFLDLSEAYVSSNLALIDSTVDLGDSDGCETSSSRPLQGQSPYVLNLQLGYEATDSSWHSTLLYNVSGERIVEVGTSGLPDVYEQPRQLLDLVIGWTIGAGFSLKFKASNILDTPVERKSADLIQSRFYAGRTFGLGLKYTPIK